MDTNLTGKLNCVRVERVPARGRFFAAVAAHINPMTLKLEGDLDILKMYLHTENEAAMLRHSKLLTAYEICMVNYVNSSQGQRSRSNVTNFQSLLAFTMGHIPTKLHQFLIRSFRDFVRIGTHTHRYTNRRHQKQYLLAA